MKDKDRRTDRYICSLTIKELRSVSESGSSSCGLIVFGVGRKCTLRSINYRVVALTAKQAFVIETWFRPVHYVLSKTSSLIGLPSNRRLLQMKCTPTNSLTTTLPDPIGWLRSSVNLVSPLSSKMIDLFCTDLRLSREFVQA